MPLGNAVSLRLLERPTGHGDSKYTVPPEPAKGDRLEADTLFEWVQAQGRSAKGYARHVISLDIAYLVCLGLFLGYASVLRARLSHWPPILLNVPVWAFWLLPAVYILCDLTKDVLILVMLNWPPRPFEASLSLSSRACGALKSSPSVWLSRRCCCFASCRMSHPQSPNARPSLGNSNRRPREGLARWLADDGKLEPAQPAYAA